MLWWEYNQIKGEKCSLTLDELYYRFEFGSQFLEDNQTQI